MEKFNSVYNKGYWKALIDVYNLLETNNLICSGGFIKSGKQVKCAISKTLKVLLEDTKARDELMKYGGSCDILFDNEKIDINTKIVIRGKIKF